MINIIIRKSLSEGMIKFIKIKSLKFSLIFLAIIAIFVCGFSAKNVFAVDPPPVPDNFRATVLAYNSIKLEWTDRSTNETGFKVERSVDSSFVPKDQFSASSVAGSGSNVTLTNTTMVAEGTLYYYRVYAYNAGGNSAFSATISATSFLKTPTGLTATLNSATSVNLAWTDVSNAESHYTIERKTDLGGTWAALTTDLPANTSSYSDSTVTTGHTYYYRVKATKTNGAFSLYSNEANVPVGTSTLNVPANLSVVATNTMILTWDNNNTSEQGYKIERKEGETGTFAEVGSTLADITTYTDTAVTEATQYFYRVRAYLGTTYSDYSQTINGLTYLNTPTNMACLLADGLLEVDMGWQDNSANESGYAIERKLADGEWNIIHILPNESGFDYTSWIDVITYSNLPYMYRVHAVRSSDSLISLNSEECAVNIPEIQIYKEAPLEATEGGDLNYRFTITNHSARQINDINIQDQLSTVLQVVAVSEGQVNESDLFTATIILDPGEVKIIQINTRIPFQLSAPTELSAQAISDDQINLSWSDNSDKEQGYILERSTNLGFSENVFSFNLGANIDSYNDQGLLPDTRYYYRVRAYYSIDSSDYSNSASARTKGGISIEVPGSFYSSSYWVDHVTLVWEDRSNNEDGFKIERSTTFDFNSDLQVFTVEENGSAYTDTTVAEGQNYYYRIRAYKDTEHFSDYSEIIPISLYTPAAASNLTASVYHTSNVVLNWADNSDNEEGFFVERSTSADFTQNWWASFGTQPNVTTYEDIAPPPDVTYYYRISVFGGLGMSGYSNVVTARPLTDTSISAPTNLRVRAVTLNTVLLDWQDNSNNEDGFVLEVSTSETFSFHGRNYTIDTIEANQNEFLVDHLDPNTPHYFRVRAKRLPDYFSGLSNTVSAITTDVSDSIEAPSNLTVALTTDRKPSLTWQNNANDIDSLTLEIGSNASFTDGKLWGLSPYANSFVDLGRLPGSTCYYRVRALKGGMNSNWSNVVSITIPNWAPSNLTAVLTENNTVQLNWQDNSPNEMMFYLYRNNNHVFENNWDRDLSWDIAANETSKMDDYELIPGNTYYYRIRARLPDDYSEPSNIVSITIPDL